MHVVQIISSLDNEAAGTTSWMRQLVEEFQARGVGVDVLTVSTAAQPPSDVIGLQTFAPDTPRLPAVGTLLGSRPLFRAIEAAGRSGRILHSSGLWRLPNVYPGWVAARTGCPLVVSPHGMLGSGALQFSPIQKRVFSSLVQTRALQSTTCFHATSEKEAEDIRAFGLTAPVALIPNGIDVPEEAIVGAKSDTGSGGNQLQRTVLYLGRVHPKKGLDRLLAAWSQLEAQHPNWDLRVVGPPEGGHGAFLRSEVRRLGLQRVMFHDGLYGEDKARAYRDADVFVLPTLDENFGMVVAEALANGTPVICTKGAPWDGLTVHGCGWWVDHGVEPLSAALSEAIALPWLELKRMGARGRDWMVREFSWDRIAADMEALYRWCTAKDEPPPFVRLA